MGAAISSIYTLMEFFTELLESYSKLKKRKLKLLVETEDPEATAQAELNAAQAMNPPPSTAQPYIAQGARAQVGIFLTKNGWKFAPITAKGGIAGGKVQKFIDTDYVTFVGYFSTGGDADGEKNPEAELMQPQLTPEEQEVVDTFTMLDAQMFDIYEGIDKSYLKGKPWASLDAFKNYVFGGRRGSLQSQITNIKTKIAYDEKSNSYVTAKVPPSSQTVRAVSENLAFALETLTKDNISENDKNKIAGFFAVNSDNTVSIFEDMEDSGLVFQDRSGFLKMIAASISKKYEMRLRKIDVTKITSNGLDNVTRGVALEEILPVFSLLKKQSELQKIGHPGVKAIQKSIQEAFKVVKDKLQTMHASYQGWVKDHEESSFEQEDAQVLRDFSLLFGDNGREMIASILKASKDAISVRQPDFILTKGKETGEGRRQDTLELFNSFDKAKQALTRMGYSDEEITTGDLIKKGSMNTVFADRPDLMKTAVAAEVFNPNAPVFYTSISLKNYIDLEDATFGSTTDGSNTAFIQGNGVDPDNKFLKKYQETVNQTPQQYEAAKAYDSKLGGISASVKSLPAKAKARSSASGRLRNITPLADFVEASMSTLKDTSTYDEISNPFSSDKSKFEFANLLEKYRTGSKENKGDLEDKIKQYASTYLRNKKLIADIDRGDEGARQYLAMKLFNSGGCVDDGLVCDYRGLGSGETYNFLQNDVMKDVVSAWLADPEGNWRLRATGNSFTFYNAHNPDLKLQLTDKVSKKTGGGFGTGTVCSVNRNILKSYNRKGRELQATMESFLQIQNDFFNRLLAIKEEVVVGAS